MKSLAALLAIGVLVPQGAGDPFEQAVVDYRSGRYSEALSGFKMLVEAAGDEMVPETDRDAGLTALNRWLLQIPVNRRAEALWDYEVVR